MNFKSEGVKEVLYNRAFSCHTRKFYDYCFEIWRFNNGAHSSGRGFSSDHYGNKCFAGNSNEEIQCIILSGSTSDKERSQEFAAHVAESSNVMPESRTENKESSLKDTSTSYYKPGGGCFDSFVSHLVYNMCGQRHSFHLCISSGAGPDKEKPPCKKAKLLRLERRNLKLASKGLSLDASSSAPKQENCAKKLEDFLYPEMTQNPAHRLQVNLVLVSKTASLFYNHPFLSLVKNRLILLCPLQISLKLLPYIPYLHHTF